MNESACIYNLHACMHAWDTRTLHIKMCLFLCLQSYTDLAGCTHCTGASCNGRVTGKVGGRGKIPR